MKEKEIEEIEKLVIINFTIQLFNFILNKTQIC